MKTMCEGCGGKAGGGQRWCYKCLCIILEESRKIPLPVIKMHSDTIPKAYVIKAKEFKREGSD